MPKNKVLQFLLVEDQQLLRELLRAHLEHEFPGCRIIEIETLAELANVKSDSAFDLSIVDLELPDGNAMEWVIDRVKQPLEPRVLILSSSDEDYVLYRALHSNIPGFVHKNDSTETLLSAIKTVLGGDVFFSSTVQKMRSRMQSEPLFFAKILSDREQEILKYIGRGLRNAEVAQMVDPPLSESTVADHRKRIMQKLKLHREADLIRYAQEKGFS
jgi:DNA-binding NarL/FixJ family response regulator